MNFFKKLIQTLKSEPVSPSFRPASFTSKSSRIEDEITINSKNEKLRTLYFLGIGHSGHRLQAQTKTRTATSLPRESSWTDPTDRLRVIEETRRIAKEKEGQE